MTWWEVGVEGRWGPAWAAPDAIEAQFDACPYTRHGGHIASGRGTTGKDSSGADRSGHKRAGSRLTASASSAAASLSTRWDLRCASDLATPCNDGQQKRPNWLLPVPLQLLAATAASHAVQCIPCMQRSLTWKVSANWASASRLFWQLVLNCRAVGATQVDLCVSNQPYCCV